MTRGHQLALLGAIALTVSSCGASAQVITQRAGDRLSDEDRVDHQSAGSHSSRPSPHSAGAAASDQAVRADRASVAGPAAARPIPRRDAQGAPRAAEGHVCAGRHRDDPRSGARRCSGARGGRPYPEADDRADRCLPHRRRALLMKAGTDRGPAAGRPYVATPEPASTPSSLGQAGQQDCRDDQDQGERQGGARVGRRTEQLHGRAAAGSASRRRRVVPGRPVDNSLTTARGSCCATLGWPGDCGHRRIGPQRRSCAGRWPTAHSRSTGPGR